MWFAVFCIYMYNFPMKKMKNCEYLLEIIHNIQYNDTTKEKKKWPEVYDNPTFLNLHLFSWDSNISVTMSGRHRTDG